MVETLITVTGTDITHDETDGLQNSISTPAPTGDADDNDVLYSALPSAFRTLLETLFPSAEALGAAESDGNIVSFSPTGTLGNISLTDANGDALDGDDSGLTTTSGDAILLYTDPTNDNVVIGKTVGGTIVFAIYLEPTGGTPPTGAKLWTVQYEAIDHGADGNDFDSYVDLTGLVHVTASDSQDFSFANAPSGQNLFMMFGSASQALLITGVDPANQSAGENVSSGSTVNSSQGGGTTTLGTNGQQVKAQQALVVTFVSGANPDYTAGPNAGNGPGEPLSATEANVEANIQFSGYVLTQAAEFTISQMQPNNAAVTVEIEAYLTSDVSGNGYLDGNPIVQGDTQVNITTGSVEVIRDGVNVVGTAGVTVDYTGNFAVITGLLDDDIVKYATDADHNRVLIRNDQPASGAGSNIAFDLGGFSLTEVDGDTDEIGSKIIFEDDGLSIAAGTDPAALTVDETALGTDASGSFAGLFTPTFGTDGEAATDALVYELGIGTTNSGLVDTATGNTVFLFLSADGTTITGREGADLSDAETGETVFVITVDPETGEVTLDQQRAIVHPTTDPDESKALADDVITLTLAATDGDTDTAGRTTNIGDRFVFKDDGPSAGTNTAVQLDDETAQTTEAAANSGGTGDASGTSATASGTLDHAFGNDGAGTVLLTAATLPLVGGFSQVLSADGAVLTIRQMQNGVSVDVLKVEVTNPTTGAYTVTHLAQIFHPTPGTSEEDVSFTINYEVTDEDGDTATSSVTVNADDDTATVAAGTDPTALTVDESDLSTDVQGDFTDLFTVSFGADGEAASDPLIYTLGIGAGGPNSGVVDTATGDAVYLFLSSDGTTLTGKAGTSLADAETGPEVFVITVNSSSGVVTLDQKRAIVHADDSDPDDLTTLADNVITLTASATDGDLDVATRTENVGDRFILKDDGPAMTIDDAVGNYDDGATGDWNPTPGADGVKALGVPYDSLNVSFDAYEIGANGSQTTSTTNSTFSQTGDYSFAGSITDDFNGDGIDDTVAFTLEFDPTDPESYELLVTTPPASVIVRDSSQGALKASGPNSVRTLLFGGSEAGQDDVLFFGVVANAPPSDVAGGTAPNDLQDLVVIGATDLDEGQVRSYLSPTNQIPTLINAATQMNVSTSGIGINNNNLDGSGAGIQLGDESFIFNPEEAVDSVRVYIDNSVGGYSTATEALYYRIFYIDGTVSDQILVTSGMLSDALRGDPEVPQAAQGGKYFEIDENKQIDAVQLTMANGTIKIPVIQWTIEQAFDPEDLHLEFTGTLFDGDDDASVPDSFAIDLDAVA